MGKLHGIFFYILMIKDLISIIGLFF